jgi:Flp pilus assembly protein TadD
MKMKLCKILAMLAIASVLATGCTNLSNMVKKHATDAEYVQTPDPMEMHGDKVKINIAGSYKPNYFHKKAGVLFQPELEYDGGSVVLKPMLLKGESAQNLNGTTIPRAGGKFNYTFEIPYSPEYKDARLVVNPVAFPAKRVSAQGQSAAGTGTGWFPGGVILDRNPSPGRTVEAPLTNPASKKDAFALKGAVELGKKVISTGVITTPLLADINSATPTFAKDNYKKPDNIFNKGTLFFVKDLSNLNMKLAANQTEAAKQAFAQLEEALKGGMEIASIKIVAWASPEGEHSRNDKLAHGRAQTGEKYLRDVYKKVIDEQVKAHNAALPRGAKRITAKELMKDLPLTIEAKGEDWDGFMTALRASNVRDRDRIINVIQSNTDRARREQEMRNMIVIYPELEEQLLPPLRRAEMAIELIVPAKTNEEMAELSVSNPSALTVEELLFAATLTQNDAAKLQVYTSATQVYPNDWRGFNNVAFLQIQNKNYNAAETALQKANTLSPNNGTVLNNLGAVALGKDDFETAKKYFEEAKSKGNAEAGGNLAPILIKEGDYATAAASTSNRSGDLNLALAHILLGNLPAAKQTLASAKPSPKANYLKAIVAAREDNASEVAANLRNTDADYKKQARTDAEFRKYANQTDFVEATK